jgi:hypothetical protein
MRGKGLRIFHIRDIPEFTVPVKTTHLTKFRRWRSPPPVGARERGRRTPSRTGSSSDPAQPYPGPGRSHGRSLRAYAFVSHFLAMRQATVKAGLKTLPTS